MSIIGEYKYVAIGTVMPPGWVRVSNYDDVTPTILANSPKSDLSVGTDISLTKGTDYEINFIIDNEDKQFSVINVNDKINKKTGTIAFLNVECYQYDPNNEFSKKLKATHLRIEYLQKLKNSRPEEYKKYLGIKDE